MSDLFKDLIDEAVRDRDVALLTHLIRRADTLRPEIREHLAAVIEGLLTKKIKFPNRKPKQDLEEKRLAIAVRVREVKKTKGWKLRSVVDSVAKEMRCSPRTVWSAWDEFGSALDATEVLSERYDIAALVEAVMTAGRAGAKLSDEQMKALNNLAQESLDIQQARRRK
jgi:hypothetical protein